MADDWLGKTAVLWALDRAPDVPPALVSTLIAVARYADENGRGAYPSATTVARHTRKSERQAKRDLADLLKLGLLLPGDRRLVAKISADKRPNVYDVPIHRGVTHDTPRRTGVSSTTPRGVSPMTERGVIQGPSGVSPVSPKEFLKNSGKGADAASLAPAAPNGRCAVHLAHFNGAGVCALCRSEQVGAA